MHNFLLIQPAGCALWTWYVCLDLLIFLIMPLLTFIAFRSPKRGVMLILFGSIAMLLLDFFHMEEPKNELYVLYHHQG